MRRRSFQMAVHQSTGSSKLSLLDVAMGVAEVAILATADASRDGGPLQISEGVYWSSGEQRHAAIVNVGRSLEGVGERVTVAATGSSFGEASLLQAKVYSLWLYSL